MKKAIIPILFFILLASAVFAQPFFAAEQEAGTLDIAFPKNPFMPYNATIDFHFHVHNSTGYVLDNTTADCVIHIYNSSGNHLLKSNLTYSPPQDFEIEYNLTSRVTETLTYLVYCNSTQGEAGFISNSFEITRDGLPPDSNNWHIILSILLPLIICILLWALSFKLDKEHQAFKIFLIGFGLTLKYYSLNALVISLSNHVALFEVATNFLRVFGWLYWIVLFYFALYFFKTIFDMFRDDT